MRIHKTTEPHDQRPVLYRHAKCKHCDHRFTYHLAATRDTSAKRPECPECGTQGIGGPFGRTNPAEWLPIIQAVGEDTRLGYADWLAGDAALVNRTAKDRDDLFVFVGERREYLPCRTTVHRRSHGIDSTGFGPETWGKWISNGADIGLIDIESVPDQRQPNHFRGSDGGDR